MVCEEQNESEFKQDEIIDSYYQKINVYDNAEYETFTGERIKNPTGTILEAVLALLGIGDVIQGEMIAGKIESIDLTLRTMESDFFNLIYSIWTDNEENTNKIVEALGGFDGSLGGGLGSLDTSLTGSLNGLSTSLSNTMNRNFESLIDVTSGNTYYGVLDEIVSIITDLFQVNEDTMYEVMAMNDVYFFELFNYMESLLSKLDGIILTLQNLTFSVDIPPTPLFDDTKLFNAINKLNTDVVNAVSSIKIDIPLNTPFDDTKLLTAINKLNTDVVKALAGISVTVPDFPSLEDSKVLKSIETVLMDVLKAINNIGLGDGSGGSSFWDSLFDLFGDVFEFIEYLIDKIIYLVIPENTSIVTEKLSILSDSLSGKMSQMEMLQNTITTAFTFEQKEVEPIFVDLPIYGTVDFLQVDYLNQHLPKFRTFLSGFMFLLTSIWAYRKITTEMIK